MIHRCDGQTDGRMGDSIYALQHMLSRVKTHVQYSIHSIYSSDRTFVSLTQNPPDENSVNLKSGTGTGSQSGINTNTERPKLNITTLQFRF